MVSLSCNAKELSHYFFLQPDEIITGESNCWEIYAMREKLIRQQPALLHRKKVDWWSNSRRKQLAVRQRNARSTKNIDGIHESTYICTGTLTVHKNLGFCKLQLREFCVRTWDCTATSFNWPRSSKLMTIDNAFCSLTVLRSGKLLQFCPENHF